MLGIGTADKTRASIPRRIKDSCKASEFITVASIPMLSARVLSISPLERPRQKLPPPTTIPTSTPAFAISLTAPQTLLTILKSKPCFFSPASTSPLSFKSTLLNFGSIKSAPSYISLCPHLADPFIQSIFYNKRCRL